MAAIAIAGGNAAVIPAPRPFCPLHAHPALAPPSTAGPCPPAGACGRPCPGHGRSAGCRAGPVWRVCRHRIGLHHGPLLRALRLRPRPLLLQRAPGPRGRSPPRRLRRVQNRTPPRRRWRLPIPAPACLSPWICPPFLTTRCRASPICGGPVLRFVSPVITHRGCAAQEPAPDAVSACSPRLLGGDMHRYMHRPHCKFLTSLWVRQDPSGKRGAGSRREGAGRLLRHGVHAARWSAIRPPRSPSRPSTP